MAPTILYGKNLKQWIFQQLVWSMIQNLVDAVNIMGTWNFMSTKGQGHS